MRFFESRQELGRILGSALLIYPFIVLSVRMAGKRSTSKMNNFDWIVTVALGAIVGSAVIVKDVVIAEAYVAIGLLLGLQFALTKAAAHGPVVAKVVRKAGLGDLSRVRAVVLEADSSFSVLGNEEGGLEEAGRDADDLLRNVEGKSKERSERNETPSPDEEH